MIDPEEIEQPRLTNRERSRKPHKTLGWCGTCDRDMVSAGSKCPTCGKRESGNETRKRDARVYE